MRLERRDDREMSIDVAVSNPTEAVVQRKHLPIGGDPLHDFDVIRHERGDLTLEQSGVALDDENVVDLRLVVLVHHCGNRGRRVYTEL